MNKEKLLEINKIWQEIQEETRLRADAEPVLASFFHSTILEHSSFSSAIANQLANDLANVSVQPMMLRNVIKDALNSDPKILENIDLLGKVGTIKPTLSDLYNVYYANFLDTFIIFSKEFCSKFIFLI